MDLSTLTIIDGDLVEAANLDRQPLYEAMDIGRTKAGVAAMWMRQVLIAGTVRAQEQFLDSGNASALLADHDIVVEGVDDLHAKELIARTCRQLGLPLVSGGVHRDQGQVLVLTGDRDRDQVFSGRPGMAQDGCDMQHVPLDLLEEVGRRMAERVHDLRAGRPVSSGRLELYEAARRQWTSYEPPAV